MSNGSITPAQVNAFLTRQLSAVQTAAQAAVVRGVEVRIQAAAENALLPPGQADQLEVAGPGRTHASSGVNRDADLTNVDKALSHLQLYEMQSSQEPDTQSLLQLGDELQLDPSVKRQVLDDELEEEEHGEAVSANTRDALAALVFAAAKPPLPQALVEDEFGVQPFLDTLRLPVPVCTPDEARAYLDAARQHVADAVRTTLPLLVALPATEKQAVAQLLNRYVEHFSPIVIQQLMQTLRVK